MNYQQLKLDDPGGTVESAYNTLKVMTLTVPKQQNRIDLRDIYNACGSTDGELIIQALEVAATWTGGAIHWSFNASQA